MTPRHASSQVHAAAGSPRRCCGTQPTGTRFVTQLGHEYLRRHDLRHTGLTWVADAGVPVHLLRRIAGHGSLVTTQRYLHPDAQSIADAGTALSAHLACCVGAGHTGGACRP
jgi:hypothetical protein